MTVRALVALQAADLTGGVDSLDAIPCESRTTGDVAFVLANSTLYRYDAASVGPANGTTVIKAADGEVGTGFWLADVVVDPAVIGAADRNIAYGNAGTLDFMAGWRSSVNELGIEAKTASASDPWIPTFTRNYIALSDEPWLQLGSFDADPANRYSFWSFAVNDTYGFWLGSSPSGISDPAFLFQASAADNPARKSGTLFSDETTRVAFFSRDAFLQDNEGVIRIAVSNRSFGSIIDMRDTEAFLQVKRTPSDETALQIMTTTVDGTDGIFLNRIG